LKYQGAEEDRQMLVGEVTKMRQQYEQLISQMEQTKDIIDKQQVSSILTVGNIPDIIVYILLFFCLRFVSGYNWGWNFYEVFEICSMVDL